MGRRLDDCLRHLGRALRSENAGADKDTIRAELHHKSGIRRCSNAAGSEVHNREFTGIVNLFHKLECEPAPLILGFVLGPLMEENLRRAMLLSHGDPTIFFTRPISLAFMLVTLLLLVVTIMHGLRSKREKGLATTPAT